MGGGCVMHRNVSSIGIVHDNGSYEVGVMSVGYASDGIIGMGRVWRNGFAGIMVGCLFNSWLFATCTWIYVRGQQDTSLLRLLCKQ